MGIVLTLLAGIIWGSIGIVLGMATRRRLNVLAFMTCASLLSAIGAWIMLVHWPALLHGHLQRGPQLFLLMSITGIFGTLGMFALQKAMTGGAATWSMGQSAMVVPFAFGIVVMREALTLWGMLGMLTIVVSLIAFAITCNGATPPQSKSPSRWFHFALVALCLLGTGQTLSTIPSNWYGWSDTAGLRVPLVLTMGVIPLLSVSLRQRLRFDRGVWGSRCSTPSSPLSANG